MGIERDVNRAHIFPQVRGALGSGNRNEILPLTQHPGQRELPRRRAFLLRDFFHLLNERQISGEVLPLEPRVHAPEVAFRDVFGLLELSREEAASERAVRDEADAQLPQRIQNPLLRDRATRASIRSAAP